MSVILAMHGNPGAPADFANLASHLQEEHRIQFVVPEIRFDRTGLEGVIGQLDAELQRYESEPIVLVGYSWGAYIALQYVRMGTRTPACVILVNPYLVSTNPISPVVSAVASVPILGHWILAKAAPRLADAFLDDVFSPAPPPDSIATDWSERLGKPEIWHAAIRRKRSHQQAPLPPLRHLSCPMLVLVGSADRVARWADQRRPLNQVLRGLEVRQIEGAGHSLLWTHQDTVASWIQSWISQLNGS